MRYDCYLVLFRGGSDDLPLKVFSSLVDSLSYANAVSEEEIQGVAREVYGLDVSVMLGVDVVRFSHGVATDCQCVRNLSSGADD
jgi:hypothetical protein